jgi:hypothetical protein
MGQRQMSFRRTEPLAGFGGIVDDLDRARVGQADVVPRHRGHTPHQVTRIDAAVEHARQPIQRCVRMRAPDGLVQRRYLVVELVSTFVEATRVQSQRMFDEAVADDINTGGLCGVRHLFEQAQATSGIAVGPSNQGGDRRIFETQVREQSPDGAEQDHTQFAVDQAAQDMHPDTLQHRMVDREGRVFGGRAHQGEDAGLQYRQQGFLLRVDEAVYLVDEQDGSTSTRRRTLYLHENRANLLDARLYCRQRHRLATERAGEKACERCLADARRSPENHRMGPARRQHVMKRLPRRQQVTLSDHLGNGAWPQALGERRNLATVSQHAILSWSCLHPMVWLRVDCRAQCGATEPLESGKAHEQDSSMQCSGIAGRRGRVSIRWAMHRLAVDHTARTERNRPYLRQR